MERGRVSPAVDFQQLENQSFENDDIGNQEPLLKASATNQEIIDALKQPITGVGFLTMHQSLPTATFVSADAANWLVSRMEGISSIEAACQILIGMHREKLICHASGDFKKPFFYGFYLYHIVHVDQDDKEYCAPLGDLKSFENEWVEVEVRPALNWGITTSTGVTSFESEPGVPHFLCDDISSTYQQLDIDVGSISIFKSTHLEIDVSNKSDRVEWGHAKYQTMFRPDQAFEMVVEWLNASGSIVHELLYGWSRKAQQNCGLQMIPIPHDPLALPYSSKSDPLRGPIFIPLNIKCLEDNDRIFKEFREETTLERIFLLQEAIAAKFGFIQCLMEPQNTAATQEHQYIHCTGTVFILVTSPAPKHRRLMSMSRSTKAKYSEHLDVVPSPHEAYITRHVSGKNKDDYDNTRKMGFLWAWNHMVSKRWRTNPNVDNNFQTKLLRDFKQFCANKDNRLKTYWDNCWEAKEQTCTLMNKTAANLQVTQ